MIDMITAIKIAEPKLEKAKFCSPTTTDVAFNIIALITKLNNPKVIIVIGKDSMCKIGLITIFNTDNTILAKIAISRLPT